MPIPKAERRRRPRISTMILCEIRQGCGAPEVVRVRDLSECGVKIATALCLRTDERIWIRLPGRTDWAIARVAWTSGQTVGLSFARAVELPKISGAHLQTPHVPHYITVQ